LIAILDDANSMALSYKESLVMERLEGEGITDSEYEQEEEKQKLFHEYGFMCLSHSTTHRWMLQLGFRYKTRRCNHVCGIKMNGSLFTWTIRKFVPAFESFLETRLNMRTCVQIIRCVHNEVSFDTHLGSIGTIDLSPVTLYRQFHFPLKINFASEPLDQNVSNEVFHIKNS
jgi:hypothetical protein